MLFRRTLEGELVEKSVTRIRLMNAVFGAEGWAENIHVYEDDNRYEKRDRSDNQ